jgi:hypothetical protein
LQPTSGRMLTRSLASSACHVGGLTSSAATATRPLLIFRFARRWVVANVIWEVGRAGEAVRCPAGAGSYRSRDVTQIASVPREADSHSLVGTLTAIAGGSQQPCGASKNFRRVAIASRSPRSLNQSGRSLWRGRDRRRRRWLSGGGGCGCGGCCCCCGCWCCLCWAQCHTKTGCR